MSQLFFDFYKPFQINEFSKENFVFFEENQSANNLLQKFFSIKNFNDNPYKIIIIEGDSCSGKTHLVKTFQDQNNNQNQPNFISCEHLKKNDPFNLFDSDKFFVIDDIDLLKNDEKLLQVINCALESRSMLVMISRGFESFILPDLKSRLKNFNTAKITQTNINNLKLIFTNILSRRQILLSKEIIDYIFQKIIPQYSEIVYCAKSIEFYYNETHEKLSIKKINKILEHSFFRYDRPSI